MTVSYDFSVNGITAATRDIEVCVVGDDCTVRYTATGGDVTETFVNWGGSFLFETTDINGESDDSGYCNGSLDVMIVGTLIADNKIQLDYTITGECDVGYGYDPTHTYTETLIVDLDDGRACTA